jgi:outer membrane autotransporter protein
VEVDNESFVIKPSTFPTSHGLWTRGLGLFDRTDGDSSLGSPASRAASGGFQVGYDFLPLGDLHLGLAGGYARTSLNVDDRSSAGDSDAVGVGAYGRYARGPLFAKAALSYSNASNTFSRAISFPGISAASANSSFKSQVVTTFLQAGYAARSLATCLVEPSVALRENHLQQDGYAESGAPGMNLSVAGQKLDSLVSSLGLRVSRRFFNQDRYPLTLGARTAWEHELRQTDNQVSANFSDSPGAGFTVQGTPRPRNAAALGLDGRVSLSDNLQAYADYSASLSAHAETQIALAGLRLNW